MSEANIAKERVIEAVDGRCLPDQHEITLNQMVPLTNTQLFARNIARQQAGLKQA